MKLIIDVEKDYFEIIKYKVEHGDDYKPYSLIAKGTPYEEKPQGEFTLKELRRWLIAQGYSEGTVDDKIEDFGRFVKRVREDEG